MLDLQPIDREFNMRACQEQRDITALIAEVEKLREEVADLRKALRKNSEVLK